MKNYTELTWEEQKHVAKVFANWVKNYTDKVALELIKNKDEIIGNELVWNMLEQLYERETKEHEKFVDAVRTLFEHYEEFEKYGTRNNVLEHSGSYRNVLYDMYIEPMHK